ncbi:MAG: hypothetical protein R3200_08455 [Xanthomonadales bacterium]|nr:hypothetical protein [Xanthomonadales bacterium]
MQLTNKTGLVGNSSPVESSQVGVHKRLHEVVERHRRHDYRRPIAPHTKAAFEVVADCISGDQRPLIFDSGCGTGESSETLARANPDRRVVAIDRSEKRLAKAGCQDVMERDNLIMVRAEIQDFWRLAAFHEWRCCQHWLLYPNPWPKPRHLQRRWHAHPVFPALIALGGMLELRTNWAIYAEEFAASLEIYGLKPDLGRLEPAMPISNFERKYNLSGHELFRVRCMIGSS